MRATETETDASNRDLQRSHQGIVPHQGPASDGSTTDRLDKRLSKALETALVTGAAVLTATKELRAAEKMLDMAAEKLGMAALEEPRLLNAEVQKVTKAKRKVYEAQAVHTKSDHKVLGLSAALFSFDPYVNPYSIHDESSSRAPELVNLST